MPPLVKPTTVQQKRFYRHTFDLRVTSIGSVMLHTLIVNPEEMSMEEPARNTVTQTLGGAYVTDFGMGLPQVTLSGTTGYKTRVSAEGKEHDGFTAFIAFRNSVFRSFITSNDPNVSLYWYNWEDDEYYEIQPTKFRLQRSKAEPLLYRYEFQFYCIRKLTDRQKVANDYLLQNPSTRTAQLKLDTATSNISEYLHRVFGT